VFELANTVLIHRRVGRWRLPVTAQLERVPWQRDGVTFQAAVAGVVKLSRIARPLLGKFFKAVAVVVARTAAVRRGRPMARRAHRLRGG